MSTLSKTQWNELRTQYQRSFGYGYDRDPHEKGREDLRIESDCCADCGRNVHGMKLWWEKISYYENEWECYCSRCGLKRIHQFDGFEAEWSLSETK